MYPSPINLFEAILLLWIVGLDMAWMTGGPGRAQRYAEKSGKFLLKIIRGLIALIVEAIGSIFIWAAKKIR
jgi:hypothetical protein